jgi:hypothetical protein
VVAVTDSSPRSVLDEVLKLIERTFFVQSSSKALPKSKKEQ